MDRNLVYDKTKAYVGGRWVNIMLILLLVSVTDNLLGSILGASSAFSLSSIVAFISKGDFSKLMDLLMGPGIMSAFGVLLHSFITLFLNGALAISLFKAVKEDRNMELSDLLENGQTYLTPLVVSGVVAALLTTVVGIIPLLGGILNIILGYAMGFRIFLIADGSTADGVESVKQSFEKLTDIKWICFGFHSITILFLC